MSNSVILNSSEKIRLIDAYKKLLKVQQTYIQRGGSNLKPFLDAMEAVQSLPKKIETSEN